VDVKKPAKVIGTNTVAHIQSGLYYGYIGLVDGILERMLNEMRTPDAATPKVIATGGLARLVAEDSRFIETIDDMLTLEGLRLIYERNRLVKPKHGHGEAAGKHA
jgi:type III pantothenate kinase